MKRLPVRFIFGEQGLDWMRPNRSRSCVKRLRESVAGRERALTSLVEVTGAGHQVISPVAIYNVNNQGALYSDPTSSGGSVQGAKGPG